MPHPPADALDGMPGRRALRADPLALPELNEPEVIRHFVNLSQLNYAVDTGFYPLGSCTMKFNPKINEWAARLPGFAALHPLAPDALAQGTLELMWELERWLVEISGMKAVTLQPAAGAHGELTGILMIRAYHESRGDTERTRGDRSRLVARHQPGDGLDGRLQDDHRAVRTTTGTSTSTRSRRALGPRTAAVMLTNPSTLGLFETRIVEVLRRRPRGRRAGLHGRRQHERHPGQVQARRRPASTSCTSTRTRPSRRRTAGAVRAPGRSRSTTSSCRSCPGRASCARSDGGAFRLERAGERPQSIGRVRSYQGSTGVLVRAYAYMLAHGGERPGGGQRGRRSGRELPAPARRRGTYEMPFDQICKHEFVASAEALRKETGVRMLDIAKRLIDKGFHPPTIYFPLTVEEGMLVEPTETEIGRDAGRVRRRADRDRARGARAIPSCQVGAARAPVRRLDEATAARHPDLHWRPMTGAETPCPQ